MSIGPLFGDRVGERGWGGGCCGGARGAEARCPPLHDISNEKRPYCLSMVLIFLTVSCPI